MSAQIEICHKVQLLRIIHDSKSSGHPLVKGMIPKFTLALSMSVGIHAKNRHPLLQCRVRNCQNMPLLHMSGKAVEQQHQRAFPVKAFRVVQLRVKPDSVTVDVKLFFCFLIHFCSFPSADHVSGIRSLKKSWEAIFGLP